MIYALCTGLIIGILSIEIIPEAIHLGDWFIFFLGFIAGILIYLLIHQTVYFGNISSVKNKQAISFQTALLLTISISIHNFPIGILLGSDKTTSLTDSFIMTILLHNIPEGIILFIPLFLAGYGMVTFITFSILVGLPVGIGTLIGENIGLTNPLIWSFIISLTAGMIFVVTFKEIFIEAKKHLSMPLSVILFFIGYWINYFYFSFI